MAGNTLCNAGNKKGTYTKYDFKRSTRPAFKITISSSNREIAIFYPRQSLIAKFVSIDEFGIFMQKIRQLVEKSPYIMTFPCTAKHLCCAPTLPIQPNSSNPACPQHTGSQCSGAMHGVGFGCGHEFDAIHEKLDKTKSSMDAKSIKHITAKTICLLCYTSLIKTTGDK
jgi:hypothetical protein